MSERPRSSSPRSSSWRSCWARAARRAASPAPRSPTEAPARRRPRRHRRRRSDDGGRGAHKPGPDDTAGITDDEIVIGIHAPVTGASPIPQTTLRHRQGHLLEVPRRERSRGARRPQGPRRVPRRRVQPEPRRAGLPRDGGEGEGVRARRRRRRRPDHRVRQVRERGRRAVLLGRRERGRARPTSRPTSPVADLRRSRSRCSSTCIERARRRRRSPRSSRTRRRSRTRTTRSSRRPKDAGPRHRRRRLHQQDRERGRGALRDQQAQAGRRRGRSSCSARPLVYLGLASSARNQNYDPTFIGPGHHERPQRGA